MAITVSMHDRYLIEERVECLTFNEEKTELVSFQEKTEEGMICSPLFQGMQQPA